MSYQPRRCVLDVYCRGALTSIFFGMRNCVDDTIFLSYQQFRDEMLEEAAFPALMIVISGLLPVILMNHMLRRTD